jgi:hypothetical protein
MQKLDLASKSRTQILLFFQALSSAEQEKQNPLLSSEMTKVKLQ